MAVYNIHQLYNQIRRCIGIFMPPLKHAMVACFDRQKMPMASLSLAKDANGNLQPTIYVYEQD